MFFGIICDKRENVRRYFGTDGVRGITNKGLTVDLALRLGSAAAKVLITRPHGVSVLIGRDPRISGDMLESAIAAGFASRGADVILVGVIPTPGVACLVRQAGADVGCVISASHNSVEYNGIKFFGPDGNKLPDETEQAIEHQMAEHGRDELPIGVNVGRFYRRPELLEQYIQHLQLASPTGLGGLKIVVDGANGAASMLAPKAFRLLGGEVISINCEPNGDNINENCGSLHPHHMQEMVVREGADLGLAFDGDADRVVFSDSQGNLVDGDRSMAIWAIHNKAQGKLAGNRVVATVMSNLGLEQALAKHSITLDRTDVGDRYVAERMRQTGAQIGGEKSGHIILSDYTTTGDGLVTALQIINVVKQTGKPLSDLSSIMTELPQVLEAVRIKDRSGWDKDPVINKAIIDVENRLRGRGRLLVRPSGTEPLIRVMAEGPDADELKSLVGKICSVIKSELRH